MSDRTIGLIVIAVLLIAIYAFKFAFGWSTEEMFMVMSVALLTMIYLRVIDDDR